MVKKNIYHVIIILLVIGTIFGAHQIGLFAGEGQFMVEIRTPTGVAPQATCFLMKDGKQIQSSPVINNLAMGKPGCKFVATPTTYNLVVQCDASPMREERKNIEILPPAFNSMQTVCWGTFYSSAYCQHGKEIVLACTADACDEVVGEICKGNEIWSVCKNGILLAYKRTCSAGSCMQTVMRKAGTTILQSEVKCSDDGTIEDRYVQACISGICQQVLKTEAGANYVPCTGIGTGCAGGTTPGGDNACTYDFQCGVGGPVGSVFCDGGNLVRSNLVRSCVNKVCTSTYTNIIVKDCKGWGCDDDIGNCKPSKDIDEGCRTNSDCGTDGQSGNLFCHEGNVAQKYRTYTCSSSGVCSSSTSIRIVSRCEEPLVCDSTSLPAKCAMPTPTPTTTTLGQGVDPISTVTIGQIVTLFLITLAVLVTYLLYKK